MKLGTLLLRDAVISLSQLEAALRAQVLYGGRLGTNLVELDFIDMTTLGTYLGQVLDLPVATHAMFEDADDTVVRSFGAELAELYTAFPLRYEPDAPGTMAVAFADPGDRNTIDQLANLCDCGIAPYIAPELRIYYYLEKHYGLERKARFIRTGTRVSGPDSTDERRRTQPAGGIQMPPAIRFEPKRKKRTTERAVTASGRPEPSLSYKDAGAAIDEAPHRNVIGEALVDYAVGRFEACAVFILRDQNAMGWRLYSSIRSPEKVEQLSLALGGTSALQAAHDSAEPHRGPSPSPGQPIERKLWTALGARVDPTDMLVVPIAVRNRVVNLVYVHGFAGEALPDHLCDELIELARRAGDAYMRLITAAKTNARADTVV